MNVSQSADVLCDTYEYFLQNLSVRAQRAVSRWNILLVWWANWWIRKQMMWYEKTALRLWHGQRRHNNEGSFLGLEGRVWASLPKQKGVEVGALTRIYYCMIKKWAMRLSDGRFWYRWNAWNAEDPAGKYKDKWKPMCPDCGQDQLLWMIVEIGEVIDIIKKNGGELQVRIMSCESSSFRKWQMSLCNIMTSFFAMVFRQKNWKSPTSANSRRIWNADKA